MLQRIYNFIRNFEAIMLSVVMVFSLFLPVVSNAAWLPSVQYSISTHRTGQPANHELKFKTSSGVDSPTDTITINLSAFTFGLVGVGDIDIFHGPTTGLENIDLHAAAPGINTWGIGIAGGIITLTPPANAGPGTVPANNYIVMRVGTNAVGGINRLTNPGTVGQVNMSIAGGFGDQSQFAQYINDDRVLVHGTVPSTTTPPTPTTTPPGGGPGCTSVPGISNIQVINITPNSARITWDTAASSNSIVDYGLTVAYGNVVSNSDLVLSHAIDLTGLSPSTTYHFRVSSVSLCGLSEAGGDFTFTTLSSEPLLIANVSCSNITDTSFNVVWDTNRPADSRVEYGKTPGLGNDSYSANLVTNHLQPLTGLDINTIYYYRVISYDVNGFGATSTVVSCQTLPDTTPPTNVFFTAVPDCDSVNLNWTHSPEADFAGVRVMRKLGGYPLGPYDGVLVYDGMATSLTDPALPNDITYYYAAYAYDTNGNFSSGSLSAATPVCPPVLPPTTTPPVPPPTTTPPVPPIPPPSTTTLPLLPAPPILPPLCTTTYPVSLTAPPVRAYYGSEGTLLLEPDAGGIRGVIANETVLLRIPATTLGQQLYAVTALINGQVYSLNLSSNGTEYSGTFPAPASGYFTVNFTLGFSDCGVAGYSDEFIVMPPGDVVEAELGIAINPVPDATVTLYHYVNGEWVIWNGAPYGQQNPTLTNENGGFIFHVPNGRYYAEAAKVGYIVQRTPVMDIERNAFGGHIELIKIPPPLMLTTCEIDCSKVSYEIYIINPDGTERRMNTVYAEALDQGNGIVLYRFEDKGLDFDYNDVLIQVDRSNCEHLQFTVLKTNAVWHHQIRARIFYEEVFRQEYVLTYDSHAAYGKTLTLDLTGNTDLCEEPITTVPQFEAIPLQMEFIMLTGFDFLQDLELTQELESFIMPLLLGVSVINLATALSLFNLLTYLQFIFTQPILLFGRLRKRRWGVIYNSLSKQPVELAIVRLLHHETKMTVQTKVTDKEGRYIFKANRGSYVIEVVKPKHEFPTQYLANEKDDVIFPNIYHGEVIHLDSDGVIALNIPIDPVQAVEMPRSIVYRRLFKRIQHFIALLSVILSLIAFVISPTWFIGLVLIVQVGFYLLFRQLALPAQAEPWGRVYDQKTNKPINQAIVRIFDKKFNKLLDTQITNSKGRYGFFAEHNVYYITVEKQGYLKYISQDLDMGSREQTVIDLNVPLQRAQSEQSK
ncbi:MAG: fibronectin type III domain-containing protein [Patescibacteria group bacterium]